MIEELKDKYKGQRCFLIGSGPSVNEFDLSKIYDEPIFVASYFYLHKDYRKFNKVHYCYSSRYPCNHGNLPTGFYRWSMKNAKAIFFFSECFRLINESLSLYPNDRIYYMELDNDRAYANEGEELVTDITKPLTKCGTIVADFMLPLIYYMGFKDVYVMGCDCTKTSPGEVPPHFYDNKRMPPEVYQTVKRYTTGFKPEELNLAWKVWKDKFNEDERNIYNLYDKGNLTVLENRKYETLFDS